MGFAARALVQALPGPAAIVDADGRILVANDTAVFPEGSLFADPGGTMHVAPLEASCGAQRRLVTMPHSDNSDAVAAAKSQFLALLGHEIRTPVTAVVAMVDLLRAQPLPAEAREVVDSTRRSVHALRTLTDDLLDLARLETGTLEVQREPFALRPLLENVVEPLQHLVRRKGVLLLAAPAPELPATLVGDADRLRQVLSAVVGNAVKFTEDGEVVVTAAASSAAEFVITVSDTGPGIAAGDLERIFAPFTQADSSAARRHEGAGLGLALASRLCERMGGSLTAESAPGAGSSFHLRLPLVAAPDQPESDPLPLATRKVAVVAPTPRSLTALSWLLTSAGADPLAATLDEVVTGATATDTVVWCDDAHDEAAVGRADEIIGALGTSGQALMISTTDPRTGVVRRPGMLTAPLVLARLVAALNRERTGVRGAPVTVAPLAGGRVLLAEDNDVNRTVFRRMIQLLGVECDAVPDGAAAAEALLGPDPYDVALMDLQMPGTDGIEATQRVRAAGNETPILALTATALHGDRERCLAAGMNGHLSKPITLPELRTALAPYLSAKPAPATPLDLTRLQELEEQLEDRALVVATVDTFLAQLDGRRLAMSDALRRHDVDGLRAAAHTLKSSSALLGAMPLADACAELERQATTGAAADRLTELVERIESAVSGATKGMKQYLAGDER
ncbi:ATP-binding protein [Symbioplanes lichenis]|uniref:ATP-binding protein n=1 Tax=Symbioplanes lichenis TaxID=1629072 RepID=UPI0027390782|nr:ATP-binding protein [Actinoplanes lichenis]